jgi:hypothetical protein
MKHSIAKFLSLTLTGLGILVVAGTLDTVKPGTAHAGKAFEAVVPGKPSSDVVVVNDASQPVPTVAQGTTNVAGTVAVSNMPPVSVANTPATPVYVRDVDNPALQPFTTELVWQVPEGSRGTAATPITIPNGKTLVVEDVNLFAGLPNGQTGFLTCFVPGNPENTLYAFALTDAGTLGGLEGFVGGRAVRIYVQAGALFYCALNRSADAGIANAQLTLSGHYVNTP